MAKHPVIQKKTPLQQLAQMSVIQRKKQLKKNKWSRKRRGSIIEMEERRQMAIKLRLSGKSLKEIGRELGVGYMTIKRDLDMVKRENQKYITQFDRDVTLSRCMATFNQVEREAWEQYHRCAGGTSAKAQFLNLVRVVRGDQMKALMDVGMLSKAPQKVEHKVEANLISTWSEEAKQLVALAIIKSQMNQKASGEAIEGGNGVGRPKLLDIPPEDIQCVTDTTEEDTE